MFFRIIEKLNFKKNFPYFVCTPLIYAIGTASDQIMTAAAYARRSKKKLIIIKTRKFQKLLNYKICNNPLFDSLIVNDQEPNNFFLYKIIDFLIQAEFVVRRAMAIFLKHYFKLNIGEDFRFAYLGSTGLYSENQLENFNKILPLSIKERNVDLKKNDKQVCSRLLNLNNFQDQKFVCLHVRDAGYHGDKLRRPYRNSDINNYIDLIELLISKNYLVFRIGDTTASKINYKNKKFIDYPFTELKSEIMDLYLLKKCEFYVGTPSGTLTTADLFNKPVFLTNLIDIFPTFPRKKYDRGMLKKIVKKKTNEKLNVKDFARLSINYHQTEVEIDDIHFEENTREELFEGMKEYLNLIENIEVLENGKTFLHKDQINSNKFLNLRLEEIYNENIKKENHFQKNYWEKNQFMRIVKRFKSCEGALTNSFLKKNY